MVASKRESRLCCSGHPKCRHPPHVAYFTAFAAISARFDASHMHAHLEFQSWRSNPAIAHLHAALGAQQRGGLVCELGNRVDGGLQEGVLGQLHEKFLALPEGEIVKCMVRVVRCQ